MKTCKICNKKKSLDDFRLYRRPNSIFYSKKCRLCLAKEKRAWVAINFEKDNARNKAYNKRNADRIRGMKLVKNYWPDLTWQEALAERQKLLDSQNGHCAMCPNITRLHIDHWHGTFQIRGLLCYNCNNGIGRLKDSIEILQKAITYLQNNPKA